MNARARFRSTFAVARERVESMLGDVMCITEVKSQFDPKHESEDRPLTHPDSLQEFRTQWRILSRIFYFLSSITEGIPCI
jgi:hypothetical protein